MTRPTGREVAPADVQVGDWIEINGEWGTVRSAYVSYVVWDHPGSFKAWTLPRAVIRTAIRPGPAITLDPPDWEPQDGDRGEWDGAHPADDPLCFFDGEDWLWEGDVITSGTITRLVKWGTLPPEVQAVLDWAFELFTCNQCNGDRDWHQNEASKAVHDLRERGPVVTAVDPDAVPRHLWPPNLALRPSPGEISAAVLSALTVDDRSVCPALDDALTRAEQAEAERDALREAVKSALLELRGLYVSGSTDRALDLADDLRRLLDGTS